MGEIKLFLFEQDIDNSWIIYQTDSCQYTSKISNIVMTDEIIVFAGDEEDAALTIRQSMIAAIANNERASAEKSLTALQSLGLDTQLSAEDLRAIKDRIQRL